MSPRAAIRPTLLRDAIRRGAVPLGFVGLFSFVSNLLYFALPIYTNQVYTRVLVSQSGATLAVLTLGVLFVFVVSTLLDAVRQQVLIDFGATFDAQVAPRVFRGLFERAAVQGEAPSAQALRDVDIVGQVLTGSAVAVLFDLPWIPIFLGALFLVGWQIGVTGLVGASLLLLLAFLQDRATRSTTAMGQTAAIASYDYTESALRSSEAVRALGMLPALTQRWSLRRSNTSARQSVVAVQQNIYGSLIKLVRLFVQILIVGVGAWLVIRGKVPAGVLFANMILSGRALAPIDRVVGSWNGLVNASLAFRRLEGVLEQAPSEAPKTQLPRPRGELQVSRLSYGGGAGAGKLILNLIDFTLAPGETLGVIGPSGSGKTTLARLLVGVVRPFSGHVRLDGAEVFDWDRANLGRHIGYLPQGVELFPGTVRDNIARFTGDARDEEVIEAAKRAGAHEMIAALPAGYETDLEEKGVKLSAGQRQRIGLARAVFGSPAFVVLDEPNAALDAAGEEDLARAVETLKRDGATVVIVSHKLNIFRTAERLLLLREGRIEQLGRRDEVLTRLAAARGASAGPRPRTAAGLSVEDAA